MNRRRARILATLLLVLGGTLPGEAGASACLPSCCCPASDPAGGDCQELSTVPCCHAATAPLAPASVAPAPIPGAVSGPAAFTLPASQLRIVGPSRPTESDAARSSPLRLSVVLRI